jgi:hypothetical protein
MIGGVAGPGRGTLILALQERDHGSETANGRIAPSRQGSNDANADLTDLADQLPDRAQQGRHYFDSVLHDGWP